MKRMIALRPRPRLLPALIATMVVLGAVKAEALWRDMASGRSGAVEPAAPVDGGGFALVGPARAEGSTAAPAPATAQAPAGAQGGAQQDGAASLTMAAAERTVLEALRARREVLEQREQALAAREAVLAAAERRLARRVEELAALQQRLEELEHARSEREEAGWRGLVKLYEGMRPRDAATIFDELDMSVLVQVVDRMREAKAAPVVGAMRPDRARQLTAELARYRAQRAEGQGIAGRAAP